MADWIRRLKNKDKRQIARLISRIENGDPNKDEMLEALYPHTGQAHVLGITGSPGAGKSSLLNGLIRYLRQKGLTVAVIAIDPTSPFSGGAILGDRVRMTTHALDEGVFIRSMGSRGSLGGLCRAAKDAVKVLDAAGYDLVLLETVGVGQAELDVMHAADSVSLVLNPTAGDVVQVFKAGIMEIADIFVINKADLAGAHRLAVEIERMLDLKPDFSWRPPIVKTIATREEGLDLLWGKLEEHRRYLFQTGEWQKRRHRQIELELKELLQDLLGQKLAETLASPA
ncbi:MAG: methylmalonyl Co-A mutase-associated GTPase MeaB, partial [Thermoactinomyces sp.]